MTLPLVIAHERAGQPASCLEGLVRYAGRVARTPEARRFQSDQEILDWLWAQPVKLDLGEEGVTRECGCEPCQRSRMWPSDGLNCWEALAHYLGVGLLQHWPVEVHVYDGKVRGQRHVWPAVRELGDPRTPTPVILQRAASLVTPTAVRAAQSYMAVRPGYAQAWYNDLFGAIHFVGDKVLRIFGAGGISDAISDAADDDLPDWSRTSDQKKQREAEREAARKKQREQAASAGSSTPAAPVPTVPAAPPPAAPNTTRVVRVAPSRTLVTV